MKTNQEDGCLPTRNKKWGFWGTCIRARIPAKRAWEAANHFLSDRYHLSREEAREYLDSRPGRWLAEALSSSQTRLRSRQEIEAFLKDYRDISADIEPVIKEFHNSAEYRELTREKLSSIATSFNSAVFEDLSNHNKRLVDILNQQQLFDFENAVGSVAIANQREVTVSSEQDLMQPLRLTNFFVGLSGFKRTRFIPTIPDALRDRRNVGFYQKNHLDNLTRLALGN